MKHHHTEYLTADAIGLIVGHDLARRCVIENGSYTITTHWHNGSATFIFERTGPLLVETRAPFSSSGDGITGPTQGGRKVNAP